MKPKSTDSPTLPARCICTHSKLEHHFTCCDLKDGSCNHAGCLCKGFIQSTDSQEKKCKHKGKKVFTISW